MNILAQIIGIIAFIFYVLSFQCKKKSTMLVYQTISYLAYIVQFSILEAFTGVAVLIILIIRNMVIYVCDKNGKKINVLIKFIFCIAFISCGIYTYTDIICILPVVSLVLGTQFLSASNTKWIRMGKCIECTMWIVYDIAVGAYINILIEVMTIVSSAIEIIRYNKHKKHNEEEIVRKNGILDK